MFPLFFLLECRYGKLRTRRSVFGSDLKIPIAALKIVESLARSRPNPEMVNMPAGNSMWRLSNAISWVAGTTEDAERKLEINKVAGQVLNPA
jgi:hypothetical protein